MLDVSLIIVGTNEKEDLRKCLTSIYEVTQTSYSMEVIVVDNASSDGTSELIRERWPQVKLIRNETKMGYIDNNNLAMGMAQGRYFLVLNADITVEPNTIQGMLDFMEKHPEAAVSACKLVFEDGGLQLTCRQFPTPRIYLARLPHFFKWLKFAKKFAMSETVRKYLMLDYDHESTRQVDWFLSAFFLMRRSVVEEIGMFSTKLVQPFYLEDVEWCFRARLAGYQNFYVPEYRATHFYKRDSVKKINKLSFVHMANIFIFYRLHWLDMLLQRHRRSAPLTLSPTQG